ncbi:MAG: ATP-binding protein [Candidatus Aminicenantes bacterium]|nr:ATP-binding protein [Candidatus Aminicenantes bacterium]
MEEKVCSKCQGTGWVLVKEKEHTVARRCDCFKTGRAQALLEGANIPPRYRECTLENFEIHNDSHKVAMKLSKKWVHDFPVLKWGILFLGPCGVGKTHLAVAIIHELIRGKNVPCYFYDFRTLIRDIQQTYGAETAKTEAELLNPIFQSQVLVLDELGAKRTSDWVEETVFYIINNRYNNKKLTIFTSNYIDRGEEEEDKKFDHFRKEEPSLVDRIGIRLRSRLFEMCKVVSLEGEDYRRKVKQAGYRL